MTCLGIHNLSKSFVLSAQAALLLGNGTKFIPTPPEPKETTIRACFDRLYRRLRCIDHFPHSTTMPRFRKAASPNWEPPPAAPPVESFIAACDRLLSPTDGRNGLQVLSTPPPRPERGAARPRATRLSRFNLSQPARDALRTLRRLTQYAVDPADRLKILAPPNLVIMNADKNLGLTVMDFADWDAENRRQLADASFYEPLGPASPKVNNMLLQLYRRLQRIAVHLEHFDPNLPMDQSTSGINFSDPRLPEITKYLVSMPLDGPQHRVPFFYTIPKVHKAVPPGRQLPPGRPIVPSLAYFTTPACRLLSAILHPLVELDEEILGDSGTLVLTLENLYLEPGEQLWFATGDVESLYTNIPTPLCHQMLKELVDQHCLPRIVQPLMKLIFDAAIFRYGDEWFRQISGFVMGISPAPDIANLFMAWLYKKHVLPAFADLAGSGLVLHRRLIDDILVIWRGPRAALDRYLSLYGSMHPRIRIAWTVSDRSFEFLDIAGHKGERFCSPQNARGQVQVDFRTHQKRLNKYLYLPAFTHHSDSSLRGFIHGELLRYLRNSSDVLAFLDTRTMFFQRLRARGYPPAMLRLVFAKVVYDYRPRALELFQSGLQRRRKIAADTLTEIRRAPDSAQAFLSFAQPSPPPALFIPSARSTESAGGRDLLTLTRRSVYLQQARQLDRQKFTYPLRVVMLRPRNLGDLLRHAHPLQRVSHTVRPSGVIPAKPPPAAAAPKSVARESGISAAAGPAARGPPPPGATPGTPGRTTPMPATPPPPAGNIAAQGSRP